MTAKSIEAALIEHSEVTEVCALRDVENEGSATTAFVILRPRSTATETDLQEYCKQQGVGGPNGVEVMILAELPRSPLGRVARKELPALRNARIEAQAQKRAS